MQFTHAVGISALLILIAMLRSICRERQSRNLVLRMTPPERRPAGRDPKPAIQLWTLWDCQMELLTESTMHAFEASAKTYKPDRIAANYPPGCVPRPGVLYRADADRVDNTAVLLRTLERSADMLPEGTVAKSYDKPTISDGSKDTLSYLDPAQRAA
jgi:hypothetical protein